MSSGGPDVTGYPLERARELLAAAGVEVTAMVRVGPMAEDSEGGGRTFVIRQRSDGPGRAALVVARQWRTPEADRDAGQPAPGEPPRPRLAAPRGRRRERSP